MAWVRMCGGGEPDKRKYLVKNGELLINMQPMYGALTFNLSHDVIDDKNVLKFTGANLNDRTVERFDISPVGYTKLHVLYSTDTNEFANAYRVGLSTSTNPASAAAITNYLTSTPSKQSLVEGVLNINPNEVSIAMFAYGTTRSFNIADMWLE